jgi:hypothetical protein
MADTAYKTAGAAKTKPIRITLLHQTQRVHRRGRREIPADTLRHDLRRDPYCADAGGADVTAYTVTLVPVSRNTFMNDKSLGQD